VEPSTNFQRNDSKMSRALEAVKDDVRPRYHEQVIAAVILAVLGGCAAVVGLAACARGRRPMEELLVLAGALVWAAWAIGRGRMGHPVWPWSCGVLFAGELVTAVLYLVRVRGPAPLVAAVVGLAAAAGLASVAGVF
jgi:hypothetical protein